jgi:hypothetical protein
VIFVPGKAAPTGNTLPGEFTTTSEIGRVLHQSAQLVLVAFDWFGDDRQLHRKLKKTPANPLWMAGDYSEFSVPVVFRGCV